MKVLLYKKLKIDIEKVKRITDEMDRHTRSKSFFADKDLKENPTFEKFRNEIERKMNRNVKFAICQMREGDVIDISL